MLTFNIYLKLTIMKTAILSTTKKSTKENAIIIFQYVAAITFITLCVICFVNSFSNSFNAF